MIAAFDEVLVVLSGFILLSIITTAISHLETSESWAVLFLISTFWIYFIGCIVATVQIWNTSHSFFKTVVYSLASWAYVYFSKS